MELPRTIASDPDFALSSVVDTITEFYSASPSPARRRELNRYLTNYQRTHAAWEISFSILSSPASPPAVLYSCAYPK